MRKFLSLFAAILIAGFMMAADYQKASLASLSADDVVIIVGTTANGSYAMANNNGASEAPAAVAVTISNNEISTEATNILWNITANEGAYTFRPNGDASNALYSINSNNGLRVGDGANNTYAFDAEVGYLKNIATSRWLGIYEDTDWRCYTAINSSIRDQVFGFYVLKAAEPVSQTKTIYCKNVQSWWTADGAAVGMYAFADGNVQNAAWPGARMTAVEGEDGLWKADIDPSVYTKVIFTRINGSGDVADWGAKTADLDIPADKDLYTITSTEPKWAGSGQTVEGAWSVYGGSGGDTPEPPVVETAKFYVTGNAALVGQDKEWNPSAIKSEQDTLVLNLDANVDYVLKVTVNGTWDGENNVKGYNELSEKPAGLIDQGNDHNIGFRLAEAGAVKVVYIAAADEQPEVFKLIGNFYVAPVEDPAKFYVTGNAALVGQDKEWNPSAIKSEQDTLVLNLDANVDYVLKVTVNGTWDGENNVKGYNELSEKPAGLIDQGNDHNIGFRLAEAGAVKVVYIAAADEQPEVFKLIGNFYVAPVEDPAKFYVTGNAALVGQDKEWNPSAIKSEQDTLVLNLDANVDYVLKVTVNGTWDGENNVKGYNELSEKPAGLIDQGNDHNIGFRLAEAGAVKVVYIAAADEQPEVFKLIGNFYVEPEPVKHYMVYGEAAIANGENWNEDSEINLMTTTDEGLTYTLTVEGAQLQGTHTYEFKIIEKGDNGTEYYPRQYGANAGLYIEESGIYTLTYTYTVATQNCVIGLQKTGELEPALADGYYLVGKFGGVDAWSVADLSEDKLFEANPDNEAEFVLHNVVLAADDQVKVVYVENEEIVVWYPAEAGDYVVDAEHAGTKDIYFRDDYQGGDGWYAGCIYVAPNGPGTGIDSIEANADAVKVLRDGQLIIIKGGKTYNVQGQTVK